MENLRGIALMTGGMAAFATGDLFIKLGVETMPLAQIIFVSSLGGLMVFLALALRMRARLIDRAFLSRPIMIRNGAEVFSVFCMTTGLSMSELATATALMQAVPLAALAGAVIFLRERVGWRRWASVGVGMAGVLVIMRPASGIEPGLVFILLGVFGLAARDLSTRASNQAISSVVLSVWSMACLSAATLAWMLVTGGAVVPTRADALLLLSLTVAASFAFFLVTASMRQGEVSAIIPFRYTRLLFALFLATVFLGERPDTWVYVGAAMIIGSGLYALLRERARVRT